MKLYYSPGACSMAAHIVALEAGIALGLVKVDLASKKTVDGDDYWKVNPRGYVPALVLDDGTVVTEDAVICQFLADERPESMLVAPFGTMERYRQMEAFNFVATEIHKQLGALFNPKMTPEMREVQLGVIERRFAALEKLLDGKPYLMGEKFSAPDAYLFTVLNWTKLFKIDLAKWPNIAAYLPRVSERPAVKEAMKSEGVSQ